MIDATIRIIDGVLNAIGRAVALLILAMIALIVAEMIMRGGFGHPSPWAHELSTWMQTAFVFLGGPYALINGKFARVDALYAAMSPRTKAIVDSVFSTVLMAAFVGVLFWLGGKFFLKSFAMSEVSATGNWAGPVWAAKLMMPTGAALLAIGWVSHILRLWRDALRGSPSA